MKQSTSNITTLLIYGSNKQGQLGITQTQTELKDHNYGVRIDAIECGGYFTVLLLESQQCCILGFNMTKMIDIQKVDQIACGQWHIVIRAENGIYSWGNNDDGQLGLEDYEPRNEPNLINVELGNIVCGQYHTIIYKQECLYTFGRGNSGQLLINKDKSCVPQKIEHSKIKLIAAGEFQTFIYSNLLQINGKTIQYNGVIKQLACNNQYSAAVFNDGKALFWNKQNNIIQQLIDVQKLSMFGNQCYVIKNDYSVEQLDGTIFIKQQIKSIHTGEQHCLIILPNSNYDSVVSESFLLSESQGEQQKNNYLYYEKQIAKLQLQLAQKDRQIFQLQNELNQYKNKQYKNE